MRDTLGIRGVKRVNLHEPLTGLLRVTIVTLEKGTSRTEIWRALHGAAFFKADCGKICIAVNDDISADNADALLWAMAYRMNPVEDVQMVPHRGQGHGPKREHDNEEDSTLLMDATMKGDMPPLALPKQEYMERAQEDLERARLRTTAPAAAVVRLFARRLAAAMGRGGQARRARPLSRERPDQRQAEAQGPQAGNQIPAGQDGSNGKGVRRMALRKNCRSRIFRKITAGRTAC